MLVEADWLVLQAAVDAEHLMWVQECDDDWMSLWLGWHPVVGVVGFPLWSVRRLCDGRSG